jgi:hypothetical protein
MQFQFSESQKLIKLKRFKTRMNIQNCNVAKMIVQIFDSIPDAAKCSILNQFIHNLPSSRLTLSHNSDVTEQLCMIFSLAMQNVLLGPKHQNKSYTITRWELATVLMGYTDWVSYESISQEKLNAFEILLDYVWRMFATIADHDED